MTAIPDTPPALTQSAVGYADWLAELKTRIHAAQQRAALAVNQELVTLYGQIGRDILERQAQPLEYARLPRGLAGAGVCAAGCCTIALGPYPVGLTMLKDPQRPLPSIEQIETKLTQPGLPDATE